MFVFHRRVALLAALCVAATFAAAGSAPAQDASIQSPKTLEGLLAQTPFMVKKQESGMYRIAVERDGGIVTVMAEEITMNWKDAAGNEVKRIMIYRWLSDTPEGFVANRPLLEKVVELNLGYNIGRIDQNKHGFFFSSGLWLRTADVETLSDEIYVAANTGANAIAVLQPLIEQSGQTKITHIDSEVQ